VRDGVAGSPALRRLVLVEALVCEPPAGGEELDSLLRTFVADDAGVEALPEDVQHRAVFAQDLRHEARARPAARPGAP
jgi:hypothetical protein